MAEAGTLRRKGWLTLPACAILALAFGGVAQAAPFVTLRLTIDKISAIDCFEGTIPVLDECTGAADFYPIVGIDGIEQQRGPIANRNNADPDPDWVFDQTVDVIRGAVPVVIEIREDDAGFRLGDDLADIDPTNGGNTSTLDLRVNLAPCVVSGDASVKCDTFTSTSGTAANNKARIFYKVEVIETDSDDDSLPDSWETRGLDTDGNGAVDVDLPAMGANPNRVDVFVEADCLSLATYNHCPLAGAIDDVVRAFANAPTTNPDTTTGIQLHVDTGPLYGAGAVTTVAGGGVAGTYGDIGAAAGANAGGRGGDQIPEAGNEIVDWDGATGNPAANFYTLKAANFNNSRAAAFRYVLFGHQNNARAAVNDCTGGWAEAVTSNDFMVTLGGLRDTNADGMGDQPCWGNAPNAIDDDGDGATDEDGYDGIDNDGDCPMNNDANGDGTVCNHGDFMVDEDGGFSVGTRGEQAGTFMHELGHTLGLDHGGDEGVNTKPNYLSVMNYAFPFCNVPVVAGVLPGGCDFSRDDLDDLVELKDPTNVGLDECRGADGGLYGLGSVNWDGNTTPAGAAILEGATCAAPNQTNVQADVNGDGGAGTLHGWDDWDNLIYMFRDRNTFDDGVSNPPPTDADPATIERTRAFLTTLLGADVSVDKTGPSDTTPGSTLSYGLSVRSNGPGPAFSVLLADTKPDGSQTTFDVGLLPVGTESTRTVTYAVPCTATEGSVLTNSASVFAFDLLGGADQATGNNADSVSTTVHAPVLTLAKTALAAVHAGEAITYQITFANTGSAEAKSVVITDTLPADVYYGIALDQGAGPQPNSVVKNGDGTTTLTWSIGSLAGASGPRTIVYTARPSLLFLAGASVQNSARLTFTNDNGCVYAPVTDSRPTVITSVPPSRNPLSHGYWKNHSQEWTAEILARIHATDQRFDGVGGSTPDGKLSPAEVTAVFKLGGQRILDQQLLGVYFNLATRRINAATQITSKTTTRLALGNVRAAALYAIATLALPQSANKPRYSDTVTVLDEINLNKSEVY